MVEGSLRAPWKWDRLLVESAVIGGLGRWRRRLAGLARELALRREECAREDPESPRLRAIDRDRRNLRHLKRFALPVIERLARLPDEAPWAAWLEALAPMVLARPEGVLAVLAELRPMAQVGPVALGEVRDVLSERLTELRDDPPPRRYGQVFVGRPEQVRGRVFDVIFVPGLAERIFPHKQRQDPLLLDDVRRALNASAGDDALGLQTQDDRAGAERLLLQLAVGAARQRLCLSYPRLHASESRPRVPSFYALDIERARVGQVPDFEGLERAAYAGAGARLAWPAPADPGQAVDDTEHDLAVLGPLLHGAPGKAKGRARYLLKLNAGLHRSLVTRWARWKRPWSRYDGLYDLEPDSVAALAAYRPGQKPYSVSALQRFAACPYQFLLSAVFRLQPREESQPLERLDPLTRGRLFHEVQAELVRALRAREALPVTRPRLPEAEALLDATLDEVAARYREELAPAIERVWADEVESMRTDLRGWLHHVADEGGEWTPLFAEFGFGLPAGAGRDPASVPEPVRLDGKWLLRGVVDLNEAGAGPASGAPLRVTDHKTGKNRHREELVVGRGEVLQPVLIRFGRRAGPAAAGGDFAPVLLHGRRDVHDPAGTARREPAPPGPGGDRGRRPGARDRRPAAGPAGGRMPLVRLPAGVRPVGGDPGRAQGSGQAGRPGGPAAHAVAVRERWILRPRSSTRRRGGASGSRSTRASSSRRRPARARRRSSSTASSTSWRRARPGSTASWR